MSWDSSSSLGGSNSSGGGGRRLEAEEGGRRDRLVERREAEVDGRPEERAAEGAAKNSAKMANEILMIGDREYLVLVGKMVAEAASFTSPWSRTVCDVMR